MGEAISVLKQTLKLNPKSDVSWNNLGYAYLHEHRYIDAIKCLQEALKIDPKYAAAYNNLSHTYFGLGKFAEAIYYADIAIKLDPEKKLYADNREAILQNLKDGKKVLEKVKKLMQLMQHYSISFEQASAVLEMSHLHEVSKNPITAEFSKILSQGVVMQEFSLALFPMLTLKETKRVWDVIELERQKILFETHATVGFNFNKEGKVDEAIPQFKEALKLNPASDVVWNNLGFAHMAKHEFQTAIDCLQKALQYDPKYAVAYNNLAIAYNGLNKVVEAVYYMDHAIRFTDSKKETYKKYRDHFLKQSGNKAEILKTVEKLKHLTNKYAISLDQACLVLNELDAIKKDPSLTEIKDANGDALIFQPRTRAGVEIDSHLMAIIENEYNEFLKVTAFKKDYFQNYNSTFFKNPLSKMKRKLEKDEIFDMEQIEQHAAQYTDSRTAQVLKMFSPKPKEKIQIETPKSGSGLVF